MGVAIGIAGIVMVACCLNSLMVTVVRSVMVFVSKTVGDVITRYNFLCFEPPVFCVLTTYSGRWPSRYRFSSSLVLLITI